MSRREPASRPPVAPRGLTQDEKIQLEKYSEIPNVKGIDAAVERIHDLFGVKVTDHYLRRAVSRGRLDRHEIGHVIHFSDRDLYLFIVLGTRKSNQPLQLKNTERRVSA